MGWGIKHTPAYIPDPRDPVDIAETTISHAVFGTVTWAGASLIAGANAGPGHLGIMGRALFSPAHVGAAGAGTNALADTVYALRIYSTPFRIATRAVGSAAAIPLAAAIGTGAAVELHGQSTQMDKMSSLSGSGTGSTRKQRVARLGGL